MEASRDLEQLMKNLTLIDKGAQDPYIPRLRQWDKNSLDKVKNSNIMYLIGFPQQICGPRWLGQPQQLDNWFLQNPDIRRNGLD